MPGMIYTDHKMQVNKLIEHTHPGLTGYTEGEDVEHGDRIPLDIYCWHKHTGRIGKVYLPAYIGNWYDHDADDHKVLIGSTGREATIAQASTGGANRTYNDVWTASDSMPFNVYGDIFQTYAASKYGPVPPAPPWTTEHWYIGRFLVYFNTASLSGETITSARFRFYLVSKYADTEDTLALVLQNGQPNYPSIPLVTTDYDKSHYSGNGGSMNSGDMVKSSYNDFEITDLTWINQEGYTKLCLRISDDVDGIDPKTKAVPYWDAVAYCWKAKWKTGFRISRYPLLIIY